MRSYGAVRRSSRRLIIVLSTVTLLLAGGLAGVPAGQAADADPLLWAGVVQDADGRPASSADVVAYARPPGSDMAAGNALVAVARTTTDTAGRFELRAQPDGALAASQDTAGWVTVMVAAAGRDGVSVAVDSVAWEPDRGSKPFTAWAADSASKPGRWVTSPAERMTPTATHRAASADGGPSDLVASERPSVLTLSGNQGAKTFSAMAQPQGEGLCSGPTQVQDMGTAFVPVGELHLNRDWGGRFDYTTTKTTSLQVGVSYDGKRWKAEGSRTTDQERSAKSLNPSDPMPAERFTAYRARMVFKKFTWKCQWTLNRYRDVHTLEPVFWTGGMEPAPGGAVPSCANRKYHDPVPPGATFGRADKSSLTLKGAVSVAGFRGSMTSVVSDGVQYEWRNAHGSVRYLCGTQNYLTRDTRVVSLA